MVLRLSRFTQCVTDTDLKHDDKRETYGEEVEELREVFTFFISETSIPAQDNSINNNSVTDQNEYITAPYLQDVCRCFWS